MYNTPVKHLPHVITARNVNTALPDGLWWLATAGLLETSRNGSVLVAPGPVITHYTQPQERVLFSPLRDANPFFHLYEAIWMLAGRNDSAAVAKFAKTMESFAEDGKLNGAYGRRWRRHFGWDQLQDAAAELKANPSSRRVVVSMWDPAEGGDFHKATHGSKDVPCNTHVYFGIDKNGLNMTVCNRSNDMIWGGYGANYVHMGVLQEVMAAAVGVPVGSYYQMSNNFHVYPERADTERLIVQEKNGHWTVNVKCEDRYDFGHLSFSPMPMFACAAYPMPMFLDVAERLADDPLHVYETDPAWVRETWRPMMMAHTVYKNGEEVQAIRHLNEKCRSRDWAIAGIEWIERRVAARKRKEAQGA